MNSLNLLFMIVTTGSFFCVYRCFSFQLFLKKVEQKNECAVAYARFRRSHFPAAFALKAGHPFDAVRRKKRIAV